MANQANPVNQGGPTAANLDGTVDLNTNLNWDPAYAFDRNRVPGTAPDYQHNDQYSFCFYENANTYASAFSDNLAQKLNPGPQISWPPDPASTATSARSTSTSSAPTNPSAPTVTALQETGQHQLSRPARRGDMSSRPHPTAH